MQVVSYSTLDFIFKFFPYYEIVILAFLWFGLSIILWICIRFLLKRKLNVKKYAVLIVILPEVVILLTAFVLAQLWQNKGKQNGEKLLTVTDIKHVIEDTEHKVWMYPLAQRAWTLEWKKSVGRDSRNGKIIQIYAICGDICPAYSVLVVAYKDMSENESECIALKGEGIGSPGWGGYVGCAPGLYNFSSYDAKELVRNLPEVREFLEKIVNPKPAVYITSVWGEETEWNVGVSGYNGHNALTSEYLELGNYYVNKQSGKIRKE